MKNIQKTLSSKKPSWFLKWGALLLFLIILGIIIFRHNDNGNERSYTVTRTNVQDELQLAGTIDVDRRVDLGFASSGRVSNVYAEEGDWVKQGQTLAKIDQNNLQASLIQAQANNNLTRVQTSISQETQSINTQSTAVEQDILVENAYRQYLNNDLQAYLGDDVTKNISAPIITGTYNSDQEGEYIIDLYASAADSGYSYNLSGLESGRYTAFDKYPGALGSRGLYLQLNPNVNYKNTRWVVPIPNTRSTTYAIALAQYQNTEARRNQSIIQAKIGEAQVNGLGGLSPAAAQRNQAQAGLNAIYTQLQDGKIVAPYDGIIAKNTLDIGEIVSAYQPYITLFGDNKKKLTLNIPEIYIYKVHEGDPVQIVFDAYPNKVYEGTVESIDIIDTLVDGVPVYQTSVLLNTEDPGIRVGMNAKAKIIAQEVNDVLAVPQEFVNTVDDRTFVYEKGEDGETKAIPVELGLEGSNGMVEIISGVSDGQEIVMPPSEYES